MIIIAVAISIIAYCVGYKLGIKASNKVHEEIVKIKDRWINVFKDEVDSERVAHKETTKKYYAALRKTNEVYMEYVMKWRKSQVRKRG